MTDPGATGAVRELDACTVRVRAGNPSPMTLSGTNTYVVADPASGAAVVVDPGPDLPEHRAVVEQVVADRGVTLVGVVVTHHHHDHAEAVGWSSAWDVPAYAFDPARVPGTRRIVDGARLAVGELDVSVVHMPGHCADQICLHIPATGAVLTGDHVLGEGTTVIAWPDGDLGEYLASLRRLRDLAPRTLYPGHGEVVDRPVEHVDGLLAHRRRRTDEILAALAAGARTVPEIVARVYPDLSGRLAAAAGRSVRAHLDVLERDGLVRRDGGAPTDGERRRSGRDAAAPGGHDDAVASAAVEGERWYGG